MNGSTGSKVSVVVLDNAPTDPAAFERYDRDTHVPLADKHARTIGIREVQLTTFNPGPDDRAPAFYRKADLWFDSQEALERGIASPEFKILADDLGKFASGGVVVLMGVQTHADGA
jgi:uncharacterized protein (TIGR02118 family)